MAGGRDDAAAPGSKRKRQVGSAQEEEDESVEAGTKKLKSGGSASGYNAEADQGRESGDDDKVASKSGLTIRWKMGPSSDANEPDKPKKKGVEDKEAPVEDEANELRASRSQRHKKYLDSDSQPRRPSKKDKERRQPDASEQEEEDADAPPVLGPDGEPLEVVPGKEKQVHKGPVVVQQRVQAPHESVEALAAGAGAGVENLSEGQRPVAPPGAEPASIAELGQPGQAVGKPDRLNREVYRVPAHAGWFRWEHIHELERRGVPEFFNGRAPSKTAKTYKEYRDFMISKYREEPKKYLTFTEVRKMLVGDVNALRRVFEFLDHWGLINYQASDDPRQRPPVWEGVSATLVQTAPSGIRIVAPAVAPKDALYKFDAPRAKPTNVTTRPNLFPAAATAASASLSGGSVPAVEYHCDRCGAACSARRYHCQKRADFDLCPNCFSDGKCGPGMTTADFIRMDAADVATDADGGWSDQETLLLLEGLELFGDNWHKISEHVGTKSRAQCILHFIQMPIEDPFLEELEASSTVTTVTDDPAGGGKPAEDKGQKNGAEAQGPMTASQLIMEASGVAEGESLTPFADAGNPVMAQVAFLASMVGPRVAAAAAQAALAALTQEDPTAQMASTPEAVPPVHPPPSTAPVTEAPPPEIAKPPEQSALEKDTAAEENVPPGPTDMVVESTGGAPSQADAVNEKSQAEGKAPEEAGGTAHGKDGTVPEASKAIDGGLGEGSTQPAKEGDKTEGPEVKAQPMEVDAKDAAPATATTPGAVAPAAATPPPSIPSPGAPSAAQVRAAAATALAAAAVKAKLLADQEEREIARLVGIVVEAQLKKLEIKLKHFDELEEMLEREKDQIEKARQQVYAERVRLAASRLMPTTPRTPAPSTTPTAAGADTGRQVPVGAGTGTALTTTAVTKPS